MEGADKRVVRGLLLDNPSLLDGLAERRGPGTVFFKTKLFYDGRFETAGGTSTLPSWAQARSNLPMIARLMSGDVLLTVGILGRDGADCGQPDSEAESYRRLREHQRMPRAEARG